MKVVHIIKKLEAIDQDIKDLRKLEKSITRNRSFTTPIYMSIEKQINFMLGDRIKLLELKIENPPENLVKEIEGDEPVTAPVLQEERKEPSVRKPEKELKGKKEKSAKPERAMKEETQDEDEDDIPMLTQDLIDAKISQMKTERLLKPSPKAAEKKSDDSLKLLDIMLEKGAQPRKEQDKDKEKEKKVKFFRENFPVD